MKHIKLFESFDRYDFGIYKKNSEIGNFFYEIAKNETYINFTSDEMYAIKNIMDGFDIGLGIDTIIKSSLTVYKFGCQYTIMLCALGDYCYALSVAFNDGKRFSYKILHIIDDFDNFKEIFTQSIEKYLVK